VRELAADGSGAGVVDVVIAATVVVFLPDSSLRKGSATTVNLSSYKTRTIF
jgi:hypothetical protein